MSDYLFLFDLDSTITKKEILPEISLHIGKFDEMRRLTEATMRGVFPFKTSFLRRVDLLSQINVSKVNQLVSEIPLNEKIVEFIKDHRDRCSIVTGNLDIWINGLMEKIGMLHHVYCSKAIVHDDKISHVVSVIDKELMAKQFVRPLVVIGDGDNDAGMARCAEIAIGYGGVRNIAPSLLQTIDYAFFDENRCVDFLEKLL